MDTDLPYAAIDNNILDCLINAMERGFLRPPREGAQAGDDVAAFRLFLWSQLVIGSVAVKESEATRDPAKKDALWQVVAVHLPEVWPQPEQRRAWDERTEELMKFHRKSLDCRLLAEAELVGSAALITCDRQMVRRLAPRTQIRLLTPSAWWEALAIPRGTRPKFAPAPDNPLNRQTFWRWD